LRAEVLVHTVKLRPTHSHGSGTEPWRQQAGVVLVSEEGMPLLAARHLRKAFRKGKKGIRSQPWFCAIGPARARRSLIECSRPLPAPGIPGERPAGHQALFTRCSNRVHC